MGKLHRLTSLVVQRASRKGLLADGGGLYLRITAQGTKTWAFRYSRNKKAHEMGLGSIRYVSLMEARERAFRFQKLLHGGFDPLEVKAAQSAQEKVEAAKNVSFDECAIRLIAQKPWKNLKHRDQWNSTLKTYASPVFGRLPVQAIDNALVIKALQPIWGRIPETATRVRGRIEAVLAFATASGFRSGENPARWKGHLDAIFAKKSELAPVKHMPALPWRDLPAFMTDLRQKRSHSAKAVELLILTALRSGELVGGRRDEIDFESQIWIVPAERMKKKREHRIPLTPRMLQIIAELSNGNGPFLFPGLKGGNKPMSTNSILKLVKEMRPDIEITSHGFRSCFNDWASETTSFPREVVEMALAHAIENKVEAAYRRGDLLLKRRKLMLRWEEYCFRKAHAPAQVVQLSGKLA